MNNGQDKSGNAFKYSLIPLMLGVVLIFFLYRSCGNSVFEAKPSKETPAVIVEDELSPEQPLVKKDTASVPAEAVAPVTNDTVQTAE
ncbi:hypothetical protein MG290_07720 [Flavobacterium sp. CBA20B-1]|uniref:hypothetical protein n=1 Tax=unclassified Flavobacterium TaxID=196869 RepID=UPI00222576EA|nr:MULTISPECIES: hypothetical protein [unclassified Flavobacterium]WCM40865.1 hypothetical protein MG290_07720 [Flavobacterium sp. CBA20B-1]